MTRATSIRHLRQASGVLPQRAVEKLQRAVAHRFDRNGNWIVSADALNSTAEPLDALIQQIRSEHPEHFQ